MLGFEFGDLGFCSFCARDRERGVGESDGRREISAVGCFQISSCDSPMVGFLMLLL